MRWNETCILVGKEYELDGEGVPQPKDTKTVVFCNPRTVGALTWYSMSEMGISPSAEIQVRTCDYNGERDVFYRGVWHSVEEIREEGDFTCLVLRHQMSDSDDSPDGHDPEPKPEPEPGTEPEPTDGDGADGDG